MNNIKLKSQITCTKIIIMSCLTLLGTYANAGYGGGFATGAILGTGLTLAATSGSRHANRDPYYEADRERSRQEAYEIREETKLKREEARNKKKQAQKDAELELKLEHKRDQLARENKKRKHTTSFNEDIFITKKAKTNSIEKIVATNTNSDKTHKELEIKKLQLEVKKLELEELQAAE